MERRPKKGVFRCSPRRSRDRVPLIWLIPLGFERIAAFSVQDFVGI
jgi:hypothetical protein